MPATRKAAPTNRPTSKPSPPATGSAVRRQVRRALTYLRPVPRFIREAAADLEDRSTCRDPGHARCLSSAAQSALRAIRCKLLALPSERDRGEQQLAADYLAVTIESLIALAFALGEDGAMAAAYAQRFAREALSCVERLTAAASE